MKKGFSIFDCLDSEIKPFVRIESTKQNIKKKKNKKKKKGKKALKNERRQILKQKNKLKSIGKRERWQSKKIYWQPFFTRTDKVGKDFIDYNEYINSDKWVERKKLYYKNNKKKCICCETTKDIQLHHITYNSLGNELDKDIAPICEKCHKEFHKKHNHNDKLGFLRFARNIRLSLD